MNSNFDLSISHLSSTRKNNEHDSDNHDEEGNLEWKKVTEELKKS